MINPRRSPMPKGIPSMTLYEEHDRYHYYRDRSSHPLASFDREREAIAAARKYAAALGAPQVRIVFIVPTEPGS